MPVKHRFTRSGRAYGRTPLRFAAFPLRRLPSLCAGPLLTPILCVGRREPRAGRENFTLCTPVDMWTTPVAGIVLAYNP
jgi:hypothetical protein